MARYWAQGPLPQDCSASDQAMRLPCFNLEEADKVPLDALPLESPARFAMFRTEGSVQPHWTPAHSAHMWSPGKSSDLPSQPLSPTRKSVVAVRR